jgi:hypothetical protein
LVCSAAAVLVVVGGTLASGNILVAAVAVPGRVLAVAALVVAGAAARRLLWPSSPLLEHAAMCRPWHAKRRTKAKHRRPDLLLRLRRGRRSTARGGLDNRISGSMAGVGMFS